MGKKAISNCRELDDIMNALKSLLGNKSKEEINDDVLEVNSDLSLKTLFPPEFGLVDLDLQETLGTGNFGRVRLVRSLMSKKFYALKIMKKARIVAQKQLIHVQHEVRILSHVRCTFLAELYACWQDDNNLYLLLDYVEGGELFSHLRRQEKFNYAECQFFAVEIACALQYLHSLNIVYRDVKPENILLTAEGHIRLVDFGLSKFMETDQTFTLCGTPEYLAPEIIRGEGHSMAVDWWALGVLIYEMSFGYPPFYGNNPFTVYQAVLSGKISFPLDAGTNVKSAVKAFCAISRTSRLGRNRNGFGGIMGHKFFDGIEWVTAGRQMLVPPIVPFVVGEGDTANYDYFADELADETSNLTVEERQLFKEFDMILERI